MQHEGVVIQEGTKHYGKMEGESILTRPGCKLNEEEKLGKIKERFHLKGTKFFRGRDKEP